MPRINLPRSFPRSLSSLPRSISSLPSSISAVSLRSPKTQRYSAAGVAAAGAAAIALTVVPGSADAGNESQASAAKVSSVPSAFTGPVDHVEKQQEGIAKQLDAAEKKAEEEKKAKQKKAEAAAEKREAKQETSRSHERSGTEKTEQVTYANNLDGWIREALAIMDEHNIPGSYEGIHRNIMRESSGNPRAINNWDINAQNGVPSKGLLQVIKPTFDAYHVPGTSWSQYDPVANIVAACNYAADRYGTIDNVDSAY